MNIVATSEDTNFNRIPGLAPRNFDPDADYFFLKQFEVDNKSHTYSGGRRLPPSQLSPEEVLPDLGDNRNGLFMKTVLPKCDCRI